MLGAYVGAKLRQHERWGSDKWIEKYSCRTFIEGFFGTFQSRDGEGARRGWIRVVGITAIAVMTALAMVHDNLRIVRKWAQKNDFQGDDMLLQRDQQIEGYEVVPIDESPHGAIDPPVAASPTRLDNFTQTFSPRPLAAGHSAYPRSAPPGPARPSDGPTRPVTRHPGRRPAKPPRTTKPLA